MAQLILTTTALIALLYILCILFVLFVLALVAQLVVNNLTADTYNPLECQRMYRVEEVLMLDINGQKMMVSPVYADAAEAREHWPDSFIEVMHVPANRFHATHTSDEGVRG
jgi:hypothetical protein